MKRLQPAPLGGVIVLALTALLFLPVWGNGFLRWDDNVELTHNPHLRGVDWGSLRWMFTDTSYVWRYQPLAWLGWFATYSICGLNPIGYHAGNWLMHVSSAFLFYHVLLQLGRRAVPLLKDDAKLACWGVVGALAWALHPLRAEPVAWATGRLYCQPALFFLLALYCYLRIDSGKPLLKEGWYWGAQAAFAVSLLSYPAGLALPLVILILEWWWRDRTQREWVVWWKIGCRMAPFFAVAGGVLGMAFLARFYAGGDWPKPATMAQFPLFHRAAQAAYIATYYAWRPFWPFELTPLNTTLVNFDPRQARFVLALLAAAGTTLLLLSKRNRWPGLAAIWFAHLVILGPHFGLTEKPHFPTDRYSYIEGLVGCAALFLAGLRWVDWKPIASTLAVTVGLLAILTFQQLGIWKDNQTFFSHLLKQLGTDPYCYDIYYRLGIVAEEEKDMARAEKELLTALSWKPDFPDAHWRLGNVYYLQGKHSNAVAQYERTLNFKPRSAELHNNLADALGALGRTNLALDHYEAAAELNPGFALAQNNLAIALAERGRLAEAEAHFRKVIEITPRDPSAHANLGINLKAQGRTNEANAAFQSAKALSSAKP